MRPRANDAGGTRCAGGRAWWWVVFGCALGLVAEPVEAEPAPNLSRAVPSDVSLYFHVRLPSDSLEGPAGTALVEVGRALSTAGFMTPFASYLDEVVLARKRRALDTELTYWRKLLESRPWWRLFRHEFFVAGRIDLFRRAWLMGFRVEPEEGELLLSSLRELLEAFAAILPATQLDVGSRDGMRVTCLYRMFDASLEFCVTGHDGMILVSTSRSLLRHSLQLLSGESSDISFAERRALEAGAGAAGSSERSAVAWLSSQTAFLRQGPDRTTANTAAGFELTVRPLTLFPDALEDDPLLSDWSSLYVAGDLGTDGVRCFFDTDLPAGQEELGRALYRSVIEPVDRLRLSPILYRELGALMLPREEDDDLEPPEVSVLAREFARWFRSGVRVVDFSGRSVSSRMVSEPSGGRRLRGEATFPLVVQQSARSR